MPFLRGHGPEVAALLEEMGLRPNHLRRVVIDIAVGDAVTITTYGFVTMDDLTAVSEVVKRYRLEPIEEPVTA